MATRHHHYPTAPNKAAFEPPIPADLEIIPRGGKIQQDFQNERYLSPQATSGTAVQRRNTPTVVSNVSRRRPLRRPLPLHRFGVESPPRTREKCTEQHRHEATTVVLVLVDDKDESARRDADGPLRQN
jgi:hypothetical protein